MSDDTIPASSPLAKRLLGQGFAPRGEVFTKGEALWWFAGKGNVELVRLLIDEGANLDWTHEVEKTTAVHRAAAKGQCDILAHLRGAGADLVRSDHLGFQPLQWAILGCHAEAARLLFASPGARVDCRMSTGSGKTLLHVAADFNNCAAITLLVREFGADLQWLDDEGNTALHFACMSGCLKAAQLLLDMGSQTTWVNNEGDTPLHSAVSSGVPQIVEYLVDIGADISAKNDFGETALHTASEENKVYIAEILLQCKKADLEEGDNRGATPLLAAVEVGNYEAACVLSDLGANLHARDENGFTALHFAVKSESTALLLFFIERGLDIEATACGLTPLSLAAKLGFPNCTAILIESGANVEAESLRKWRPLHFAARYGHFEIAKILLENGAEPASKDDRRQTPKALAMIPGRSKALVKLLHDGKSVEKTTLYHGTEHSNWWTKGSSRRKNENFAGSPDTLETSNQLVDRLVLVARMGNALQVSRHIGEGVDINMMDLNGERAITAAARLGHGAVVELLIKEGADLDLQGETGESALWWASFHGHEEIVRHLLDRNARLELADDNAQTPLSAASRAGHSAIVALLLEKGSDPNTVLAYGYTPLLFAARWGHLHVVELLLEAGADLQYKLPDGATAAYLARKHGHSEISTLLRLRERHIRGSDYTRSDYTRARRHASLRLSKKKRTAKKNAKAVGKTQNPRDRLLAGYGRDLVRAARSGMTPWILRLIRIGISVHGSDKGGLPPIVSAAKYGHDHAVSTLLRNGANINATNTKSTALHHAACGGHTSTIRLLCREGSDINRRNHRGLSPLSVAASKGHVEATRTLLELGAKKETQDRDGMTPLLHAVSGGWLEVTEMLLGEGADIDCVDYDGYTPLTEAIETDNEKIARLLLKNGAPMRPVFTTDESPLCIAVSNGNESLVELLIEYGAGLNHLSANRETPLVKAAKKGYSKVAKILIEMGADISLRDNDNRTALSCAKELGSRAVVSLICQAPSLRLKRETAIMNTARNNSSHRRSYQYQRLDNEQIRLLHLRPGKAGDILSVEISVAYLFKNPAFEALSYEWKGEDPTVPVQCGLHEVYVTPNCKEALESLRLEVRTRTLWIDAVCINQKDKQEVNQQVAVMHQIYGQAETVLMWIGKEKKYTAVAFASFPVLYQACEALGVRAIADCYELAFSDSDWGEDAKHLILSAILGENNAQAIREIHNASYFTRAWIVQEILLGGSRCIVVCGKHTCAWSTVKMALAIFKAALSKFFTSVVDAVEYMGLNLSTEWVSAIDDMFANCGMLTLGRVMPFMHGFKATDPRDKVFAVLRLVSLNTPAANPPAADYTLSVQDVYVRAARYHVDEFNDINLILHPRSKKVVPNLPSWVPDYTTIYNPYLTPGGNQNFGEVIRGRPARTRSLSLFIDGCLLDKVAFKIPIAREMDVYDIMQAAIQAMDRFGRGLYDPYSTKNVEERQPTGITGTNFEAMLKTLFKDVDDILLTHEYNVTQYSEVRATDGKSSQDQDWESSGDDDTEIDSDVVSFIAWKLSIDHCTPGQSRNPPGDLEAPVDSWSIRSRDQKDFDFAVYERMELCLRWGWDLVYTARGHFGLAFQGEAEEGMSIALLDTVTDPCLLRDNNSDAQAERWYEYVDRVFIDYTTTEVKSLEEIDERAKTERLEIR